jgi:hypothetical protein
VNKREESREKSWEQAFVAISVMLGVPLAETLASIGEARALRAAPLVQGLGAPHRSARAHALARAIADVAIAIEATRWP